MPWVKKRPDSPGEGQGPRLPYMWEKKGETTTFVQLYEMEEKESRVLERVETNQIFWGGGSS